MAARCRACIRSRSFELSVHKAVNAVDGARSAQCHQLDLLRISGLEANCSTGGNIQPHTVGGISIEIQSTIHLEEMAVRSNLDGAIPAICYADAGCGAPFIGFDRFVLRKYSPGIILFLQPKWFVNGDKFRAIGERTFDLNLRDHLGNALHDIV